VGVCDFCDDYDYGIKQVAGNDDYDDDYNNKEDRYLFFRLFAQGEEPPNTGGGRFFSPSMQPLVFWPLLAPRRRQCFSLCALLFCVRVYDMRD